MSRSSALLMLMALTIAVCAPRSALAQESAALDTLKDLFNRLGHCWRPPPLPDGDTGIQITVLVAFKRNGQILGQPRITYESDTASDNERLLYRKAVMATL